MDVTTADRFFADVTEAAEKVIQKAEDDDLNPMNKKMMNIKKRSSSIDTHAPDTSILVDLASAGRVLVVLNDFENLVLNGFGGQGVGVEWRRGSLRLAGYLNARVAARNLWDRVRGARALVRKAGRVPERRPGRRRRSRRRPWRRSPASWPPGW